MSVARVIVNLSLDRGFDYLIPPELEGRIETGSSVCVPFGHSSRDGYVLDLLPRSDFDGRLKPLLGISANRAGIPQILVALGKWMAEYYCCTREQAIRSLLPSAVRSGKVKTKLRKLYDLADRAGALEFIEKHRDEPRAGARVAILESLLRDGETGLSELRARSGDFSESALKTLLKNRLLSVRDEEVERGGFDSAVVPTRALRLSSHQSAALEKLKLMLDNPAPPHTLLLHGVTNSGKTEVYLQAIAETIARGKSAIVLVPEIALTPQTVRRFRARFGDELSVLHSRLSEGARFDEWNKIRSGKVHIAVGARSALFAPFDNLGLIVVDEEHDSSYKQGEAPRYHARDVAVMRGKLEQAVVVLGSATPSAESFYNAECGKFALARMPEQVEARPAPEITVVDQRLEAAAAEGGKPGFISAILRDAIVRRLAVHEQTILFLNLRGYARGMMCECGYSAECPDCEVPYIYSRQNGTLTCHLCGAVRRAPERCPECNSDNIRRFGIGTERVEAVAKAMFPGARVGRMDSDVMRKAEDYSRVLDSFKRGDVDILVGTQMIAKGLHFPNVTLVGVINADMGLNEPDFRGSERVFQLIAQVAGRAGRGEVQGEVVIQSSNPYNEVITYASQLDFAGFNRFDLDFRKFLNYPPFTHLIVVHFAGEEEVRVAEYARWFCEALKPYITPEMIVAGPLISARMPKVKKRYRYLMTIRGKSLKTLKEAMRVLVYHRPRPGGVEVAVDVDAQSLY